MTKRNNRKTKTFQTQILKKNQMIARSHDRDQETRRKRRRKTEVRDHLPLSIRKTKRAKKTRRKRKKEIIPEKKEINRKKKVKIRKKIKVKDHNNGKKILPTQKSNNLL